MRPQAGPLGPEAMERIGATLRLLYQDLLDERLPSRLQEAVRRLVERERSEA